MTKANAARPIKIERLITNDTNTRYELNSGQYLHLKEEIMKYRKGQEELSENGEYTFRVEKPTLVTDNQENNPESQIKMSVTNTSTKDKTNIVVKMYHTNQTIHLQGGRRMGKVTTASLLADCLEAHWKKNMTMNKDSIISTNIALKNMIVKPGMVLRARTSSGDQILHCEKCDYKCAMKHQINTHMMSVHGSVNGVKPKSIKSITAIKRKSPPSTSPESKKTSKEKMTKSDIPDSLVKVYPCNDCGFVYNSETDLACHMSVKHATIQEPPRKEEISLSSTAPVSLAYMLDPIKLLKESQKPKPITVKEVDKILTSMAKDELRTKDIEDKEEFLDKEKERLLEDADNWRKTAQDLDIDLKQALKTNEKILKEKLGREGNYSCRNSAKSSPQLRGRNKRNEAKS